MTKETHLTHATIEKLVEELASQIIPSRKSGAPVLIYGVPRGGIPIAYFLCRYAHFKVVDQAEDADVIVDDIVDSGRTRDYYKNLFPNKPFRALIDRSVGGGPYADGWIIFPWEKSLDGDESFADNIVRLLQFIGEDPSRGGLLETPARVAKAWQHWASGYGKSPMDILKTFDDGAENYDEMVMVKDIPFYSHCEHHLAPFFGTATVAYIPDGKIVGLSKINRLVDLFARRLQVQERLTNQIADALEENLSPIGIGVIIKARHLCMESRGVCQQGHYTTTSALRGVLHTKPEARAEFMELAR